MDAAIALGAMALALGLGILLGRYVWPTVSETYRTALASAQSQVAQLSKDAEGLQARVAQLGTDNRGLSDQSRTSGEEVARLTERVSSLVRQSDDLSKQVTSLDAQRRTAVNDANTATTEVSRLTERVSSLTKEVGELTKQMSAVESQRDSAAGEAKSAGAEVSRLTERESALAEKLKSQEAQLADQQKQLTAEFENIANRILRTNATQLSENSQKELSAILGPLRERIQDFQQKVESTYTAENREVLSLKEQIRLMVETSSAIGSQADGLAKALRGDSQLLGRWGELVLERILEAAGLAEGREYVSQGRKLGLRNEDGEIQRPDIIINLPDQRTMVIDSKVPLASYDRLFTTTDEAMAEIYADEFVEEFQGHIDALSAKRYQENEKLQAHDCVLMFVPIEGALAAALRRKPELFLYGWTRRVVIVGPPTLLMTMQTVGSIWQYELQGQNAQEIARLAVVLRQAQFGGNGFQSSHIQESDGMVRDPLRRQAQTRPLLWLLSFAASEQPVSFSMRTFLRSRDPVLQS